MTHFLYVPFTGLGLYNGYRGSRWLRNRIQIFKQFVVPSLEAQTSQNFKVWISWRPQEKKNKRVQDLHLYLINVFGDDRVIFTYHGLCFWDDKYEDKIARERLVTNLHYTINDLINHVGDVEHVLMTIQPSDDLYHRTAIADMRLVLTSEGSTRPNLQAVGYTKGYIMDYSTKELREYNPNTNPPFFTIKFPKDIFIDPFKHAEYTGPYKSHEYVGEKLRYHQVPKRGFIVGVHGENISTHFNHPFAGADVDIVFGESTQEKLKEFGLELVEPLKIKYSLRKALMSRLPYGWQRKLRYILGEKFYARFYRFIRS